MLVLGTLIILSCFSFTTRLVSEDVLSESASPRWSNRSLASDAWPAIEARFLGGSCNVTVYLLSADEWSRFQALWATTLARFEADPSYQRLPPDSRWALFNR